MNLYEILQNSGRVGEGMTHFERLFAQKVGGGKINEIFGVPPLRYNGKGYDLTDYLISGNAVQDGTPSADAPVDATGSGVRTGNLLDIKDGTQTISNVVWTAYHGTITAHGTTTAVSQADAVIVYNGAFTRSGNYINYSKIQASKSIKPPAGIYTFSANANPSGNDDIALIVGDNDTYYANGTARKIAVGETFSVNGNEYVMFVVSSRISINQYVFADIMLNLGSTALHYEPYGFKLPLTVNGTEYPIYLGTVPTTRRIKKLVLTGEETIPNNDGASYNSETSTDRFVRDIQLSVGDNGTSKIILCTHLGFQAQSWAARTKTGCCIYCSGNTMQLHLRFDNTTLGITQSDTNEQRTEKLKSYLSAQYAAGTPVTVWYVLAEPETGIVNEPLMKIGDYADTVSFAQAGVTIPTVNGENVLDVPTTVPPSEVWIRGRIKEV